MNRIATYAEFWPYYLTQHSRQETKRLHAVGAVVGIVVGVVAANIYGWPGVLAGVVVGYAFAWYSHFFVEHNKPATWQYPLWSLVSEARMSFHVLTGRL